LKVNVGQFRCELDASAQALDRFVGWAAEPRLDPRRLLGRLDLELPVGEGLGDERGLPEPFLRLPSPPVLVIDTGERDERLA
jgi:hypothetical protein